MDNPHIYDEKHKSKNQQELLADLVWLGVTQVHYLKIIAGGITRMAEEDVSLDEQVVADLEGLQRSIAGGIHITAEQIQQVINRIKPPEEAEEAAEDEGEGEGTDDEEGGDDEEEAGTNSE